MPANKTEFFQPLNLSVNKSSKLFLSDKYQSWYANQVAAQLWWGVSPHNAKADVRISVVKPLHAKMGSRIPSLNAALEGKSAGTVFEKNTSRKRTIRPWSFKIALRIHSWN